MLASGVILGNKYELFEQIGLGGMGVVWKAYDRVAERLVALKFVPRDVSRFADEVRRLKESFQKVHALQHHAICPLYSLEDGGDIGYYLVMKFLEGETLDEYVLRKDPARTGIPPEQTVKILEQAALALDYAHSQNVIHRDIKPGNIFLVKEENKIQIQVIDFGLADDIRASLLRTTQQEQNEISGTYLYMAPEQWRGRLQTAATDQYALAVVAYELLGGKLPFSSSDIQMLRLAVLQEDPEPIPTISASSNEVLRKALAKTPQERFTSCKEFIETLHMTWTVVTSKVEMEENNREKDFSAGTSPSRSARNWILTGCFVLGIVLGIITGMVIRGVPPAGIMEPVAPAETSFGDIFEAAAKGTPGDVRFFLDQGADVNAVNDHKRTPLLIAVDMNRRLEIVQYLVSHGADVNTKNELGWQPLHFAARNSNMEMIQHLVSCGANVNTKTNIGWTPLHIVAHNDSVNAVEILRYLVSVSGVDINAKTSDGKTPLDLADTEKKRQVLLKAYLHNH